jgi:hypothetical protein
MQIEKARRLLMIITVVVFLVFLGSVAWGGYQYTWPKTSGVVTDASSLSDTKNNRYDNVVYYSYVVNGHDYSGQHTDSNEISRQSYVKGSSIDVYYSPVLPNLSTTQPGQVLSMLVEFFCCIFPFLLISNGVLYLPKPKNEPPAPTKGFVYRGEDGTIKKKD